MPRSGPELFVGRIPHRLAQLQPGTLLAVGVDALLLVEVDPVGRKLRLEGGTVMMEPAIHIVLVRLGCSHLAQALVGIFEPHLRIDPHRIVRRPLLGEIEHPEPDLHGRLPGRLAPEPEGQPLVDEDQLLITAVAVQIIQLRGDLLPIAEDRSPLRPRGHVADHHRIVPRGEGHPIVRLPALRRHRRNDRQRQQNKNRSFHTL